MQTTEDAGLIVFGGVEVGNDHIIRIREGNMAGWAAWPLAFALTRDLAAISTFDTEDMAGYGRWSTTATAGRSAKLRGSPASGDNGVVIELLATLQHIATKCMLHRGEDRSCLGWCRVRFGDGEG